MPVKLNTVPAASVRPAPPKPLRWLSALVCLIGAGVLLMRFFGNLVGHTSFWWFALGIPAVFWFTLMIFRLAIYLMQQIQANAWDKRREQVILHGVRRGRRALQILAADCITAHSNDEQFVTVADALLNNENKLFPQTSWEEETSIRHSRLPVSEEMSQEALISNSFDRLLINLAEQFSSLPPENPVVILFETSCSLPKEHVQEIWMQAWQASEICQPVSFMSGHGLSVIDHWLDHRIKSYELLLIIAVQIAPKTSAMSAESVVSLLLGNRLTQKTVCPLALLHRPEGSAPQQTPLQAGLLQSADWVPLVPDEIQHLWMAEIYPETDAYLSATAAQGKPPLLNITQASSVHDFNSFLGDPGIAGPWLAIAAAALAMRSHSAPHMILSGEHGSDTVWSTVVSPVASHKENKA